MMYDNVWYWYYIEDINDTDIDTMVIITIDHSLWWRFTTSDGRRTATALQADNIRTYLTARAVQSID